MGAANADQPPPPRTDVAEGATPRNPLPPDQLPADGLPAGDGALPGRQTNPAMNVTGAPSAPGPAALRVDPPLTAQPADVAGRNQPDSWQRRVGFDNRFAVEFPQDPWLATSWGDVGRNAIDTQVMWCVVGPLDAQLRFRLRERNQFQGHHVQTLELAVVECTYRTAIRANLAGRAVDATLKEWLTTCPGAASEPVQVDLGRAYARDFTVAVDNGNQALLRIIVRANAVYLLSAVYADPSSEKDAHRFLDSFQLNDRPSGKSR